jgi:hypothetical protein
MTTQPPATKRPVGRPPSGKPPRVRKNINIERSELFDESVTEIQMYLNKVRDHKVNKSDAIRWAIYQMANELGAKRE